jgi:hypothetical protein
MKYWYIFLSVLLASCSTLSNQQDGILYNEYLEYVNYVNSGDESAVKTKFTKSYMEAMIKSNSSIPKELGLNTPLWEDLATTIRAEHSHYEKTGANAGCLTINGLDKLDRPRSLSLYYLKENDKWLINYFGLAAHDSISEYYHEPTCPDPGSF